MAEPLTGASLGEHIRRTVRSVRDDHADGALCEDCNDAGCPRLKMWGPAIVRLGAALDELPEDVSQSDRPSVT